MIVAIRHGPVVADGICYGRWNPPVVNPPEADAETVLASLAGPATHGGFVRIVSSPADRCRHVAARLADRLAIPLVEDHRIVELSMGCWEGKPWHWIETHDGERLRHWMERWQTEAAPDGESLADLEARVAAAAAAAPTPGPTLWITHAGVIRTLRVLFNAVAWPDAMQSRVPHLAAQVFPAATVGRGDASC